MYSLKRVAVVLPVLVLLWLGSLTVARADTVFFTSEIPQVRPLMIPSAIHECPLPDTLLHI
jgi:hypothetical protein